MTTTGTTIEWNCSVCGKAVDDGAGYLTIDIDEVNKVEDARREWDAAHPRDFSVDELLAEYPRDAGWLVFHGDCDPEPDRQSYWFDVGRIRSPWDVVAWTAHLMEKSWLPATSWDSLIGKLAKDHGSDP